MHDIPDERHLEHLNHKSDDTVDRTIIAGVAKGEKDATGDDLAFQLLASPKDHAEFVVVRDSVLRALEGVCEDVKIEVEKEVLKHASVQHLYGRLAGRLGELPTDVDPDAALLEALLGLRFCHVGASTSYCPPPHPVNP